ncbi:hypothetical protein RSOL_174930 [Rhizoctonia solani AG-3 Rhs1AP]|uniref:Copia-like polyprotein/retrotransposon n=2 Tax=Rhizoctonia solani AG-3 TaxID=1086053 RepID=X8J566_9AGAM|nr:hypothetical protein RSOL_174930 [Rhizoctonia solani AG-3 Rhs1AP]
MVFNNNQGIISTFADPLGDLHTKHIDSKFHFAQDKANNSSITLHYIRLNDNWADVFTKALPYPLFSQMKFHLLNQNTEWEFNDDNNYGAIKSTKREIEEHCNNTRKLDFTTWDDKYPETY